MASDLNSKYIYAFLEQSVYVLCPQTRTVVSTLSEIHAQPVTACVWYPLGQFFLTGCRYVFNLQDKIVMWIEKRPEKCWRLFPWDLTFLNFNIIKCFKHISLIFFYLFSSSPGFLSQGILKCISMASSLLFQFAVHSAAITGILFINRRTCDGITISILHHIYPPCLPFSLPHLLLSTWFILLITWFTPTHLVHPYPTFCI